MMLLDFNENPFDLPEEMKREIMEAAMALPLNRYRSPLRDQFVAELARYSSVDPEMIMFGNGADEIISIVISACCGPNGRVIIPDPSFSGYPSLARMANTPVELVRSLTDFAFDVDQLQERVARGPAPNEAGRGATLVFLCRPNNPTGHLYPLADVERLCEVREDALVVVDEAYYEFAGSTSHQLVDRYPNLLIMRTMSKAFSLAGVRLGYAFGQQPLVRRIDRTRPPFNTGVVSYAIGIEALKRKDHFLTLVDTIKTWREELMAELAHIEGIRPFPSHTNFILIEVGPQARQLQEDLLAKGIRIRHYGEFASLENYLRISIGTPEQNQAVLQGLRKALK